MTSKQLIQSPFYDLFKNLDILQNSNQIRAGDVSIVQDKQLGKRVLKINGSICNNNYVIVPDKKIKSLNLIGQYVYFQGLIDLQSPFAFQIDLGFNTQIVKLSFSTIFKSIKKLDNFTLQIPFSSSQTCWTTFIVDIKNFFDLLKIDKNDFTITQIKFCANICLKNIYTSDELYNFENFPKEFAMRMSKNESYQQLYGYTIIQYDNLVELKPEISQKKNEDKKELKIQENLIEKKENRSSFTNQKQADKKLSIVDEKKKTVEFKKPILKNSIKEQEEPIKQMVQAQVQPQQPPQLEEIIPKKKKKTQDGEERNHVAIKQSENIDNVYSFFQPPSSFILEPSPLLRIQTLHGFSGRKTQMNLIDNNKLIYSIGPNIVQMNIDSKQQQFYFGGKSPIQTLNVLNKEKLMISLDQNCEAKFWNTEQCIKIGSFDCSQHLFKILSSDLAFCEKKFFLLIAGLNKKNQIIIILIDNQGVVAKQISDFDIKVAKFIDKEDIHEGFVCVGKENIRFYKYKREASLFIGHSVHLGKDVARDTIFTDICILRKNASKDVFVSNDKGSVYIIDINLCKHNPLSIELFKFSQLQQACVQELSGIFKLHDNSIISLSAEPHINIIATSDTDGRVRIWNQDFSDCLFEGKLESQVTDISFISKGNQIVCGSLNGTLSILDIAKRKLRYLVRSHTSHVTGAVYHKKCQYIITICDDHIIRVWDTIYEFRCVEDMVTSINVFSEIEQFICGFESGSIRIFNLLNFNLVLEKALPFQKITRIEISSDNKYILIQDQNQVIYLFDQDLELLKQLGKGQQAGFIYDSNDQLDNIFILEDKFSVKFLDLNNYKIRFSTSFETEVIQVCISKITGDLFILTNQSRKYFQLQSNSINFLREFRFTQDSEIDLVQFSDNCKFQFTLSKQGLLQLWDYYLRGDAKPAFQSYDAGEKILYCVLTDSQKVIGIGLSGCIYLWKAQEKLGGIRQEKVNFKEMINQQQMNEQKEQEAPINNEEIIVSSSVAVQQLVTDQILIQTVNQDQITQVQQITKMHDKNETQKTEDFDLKNEVIDKNQEEIQLPSSNISQYNIRKTSYLGINTNSSLKYAILIWNSQFDYYAYVSQNNLIISFLNQDQVQKIITLKSKPSYLKVSPRLLIIIIEQEGKVLFYDAKTLSYLKEMKIPGVEKIVSCEISACENYILMICIKQESDKKHPYLFIWEVASMKMIACTLVSDKDIQMSRWNPNKAVGLEFAVLSKENLQFWRISNRRQLEFQDASFEKQKVVNQQGFFNCMEFVSTEQQQFVIVGTSNGSIIFFDAKGAALSCVIQCLIKQPIELINILSKQNKLYSGRLTVCGNFSTVISWEIKTKTLENLSNIIKYSFLREERLFKIDNINRSNNSNFKVFFVIESLEEVSDSLMLDSFPICLAYSDEQMNQFLALSKLGTIWYLDYEENATLKLQNNYQSSKSIKCMKSLYDLSIDKNLIFSVSNDAVCKIWDLNTLNIHSEIQIPKKGCLSMDVSDTLQIYAVGLTDGSIRFFNYVEGLNLGQCNLLTSQNEGYNPNLGISVIKFLGSSRNMLVANLQGQIFILYIQKGEQFHIDIKAVTDQAIGIQNIEVHQNDYLNLWISTTQQGKNSVWQRKTNRQTQQKTNNIEDFDSLEYYLLDNFKLPLGQGLQNLQYTTLFSNYDQDVYLTSSSDLKFIIIRNYKEHINLRNIELGVIPQTIQISHTGDVVFIGTQDGKVKLVDYNLGLELDRHDFSLQQVNHISIIKQQQVSTKYLETYMVTSSSNEIVIWKLN